VTKLKYSFYNELAINCVKTVCYMFSGGCLVQKLCVVCFQGDVCFKRCVLYVFRGMFGLRTMFVCFQGDVWFKKNCVLYVFRGMFGLKTACCIFSGGFLV